MKKKITKFIIYNSKGLVIKAALVFLDKMPFIKFWVLFSSIPLAVLQSIKNVKFWSNLFRFAQQVNKAPLSYIVHYFYENALNLVWSALIFYNPKKFLKTIDCSQLKHVNNQGGVILLGCHVGPHTSNFILNQHGLETITHMGATKLAYIEKYELLLPFLRTPNTIFKYHQKFFKRGQGEKSLLKFVQSNGIVTMFIDAPVTNKNQGYTTLLFGKKVRFSYFPFSVSLKYNIPVYFFLVKRIGILDYQFTIEPLLNFDTPVGGLELYYTKLENHLEEKPHEWFYAKNFINWN